MKRNITIGQKAVHDIHDRICNLCNINGKRRKLNFPALNTADIQHVIDECRSLGYRVLIACITAENTGSLEFHKSLGFTQVSFFHNVGEKFGRLLDVIDMELQL